MANELIKITYEQFYRDVDILADTVKQAGKAHLYKSVYPVSRNGTPVAVLLGAKLGIPVVDDLEETSLIVNGIADNDRTLEKLADATNDIAALYVRQYPLPMVDYTVGVLEDDTQFPWEKDSRADAEGSFRDILEYLGEDPSREGLRDTPKRYIRFMEQFLTPDQFNFTTFENEGTDEMIMQKDIPFFSLCEHHTAPFFGTATVAYMPGKQIVGLSKLARTVHHYARRFQNQERITTQIAERLEQELQPLGVAVTIKARHLCMEMRGVKTHDVHTITTKLTGIFKSEAAARAEFISASKL